MRKSRILIAVGPILVLIGIGLVVGAMLPAEFTETFTIPEGNYYYAFESTSILGLRIEGEFEVDGLLETVSFYVMTPEQYDAYATTGATDAEYSVTGHSASFDVSLDTTKAYLVFEHGLLWTLFSQDITITYTLHGTGLTGLVAGVALAVVGVVLVVFAVRMSKKEAMMAPPPAPTSDVMMFDQQKPPGNP
ncbi:MAG: hypothetical protein MUC90_06535 [Thermoplasmata archaeon]|jgi:hypothetical protein|nr:hypothetical protein [Thermoplasmata archaeon]